MCSLEYVTPASGCWGVIRIAMLVPESRELFICPSACGRHGSIGASEVGLKHRLSYLFIDQSDIIDGCEELIINTVPQFLSQVSPRPKVLFLFVSCLDDLIGTNHEAVISELRRRVPDVEFAFGHMNPISLDSKTPPPVSTQRMMYDLLKPQEGKDRAVNLIGNLEDVPCSELYTLLEAAGYKLRHISHYSAFEGFQEMARSSYNLVLDAQGKLAAESMRSRLSIPFSFLPVDYSLEANDRYYDILQKELGLGQLDLRPYRDEAERSIDQALDMLSGYPLALDNSGAVRPYSLAAALSEYGFNVVLVAAPEPKAPDKEGYKRLMVLRPDIPIIDPAGVKGVRGRGFLPECVAVGSAAGYLTGSVHPCRMSWDTGFWGYRGITGLMQLIMKGYREKADLRAIIKSQGLVI